jgi:hypothetical protein
MAGNTAYVIAFWIGLFVYMWYQARAIENERLKHRPKGDSLRLIGAAVLVSVVFIGLLFILPLVDKAIPWSIGALSLSGVVTALLGICAMVLFGLFLSRKSENVSVGSVLGDGLKVLGGALLIIVVMFGAFFIGPKVGIPEPWNVWAAGGVLVFGLLVKNYITVRRTHRTSLNP